MASPVHRLSNAIINSELAKLRLASTTPKEFREVCLHSGSADHANKEIQSGRPTLAVPQKTPVSGFQGERIKPKIGLAPILRAGLGMTSPLVSSSL
jgi:uracil phosphoribosyltransferase